MIYLEDLFDGGPADRNFQTLRRVTPDTGGLSIRLRAGGVTAAGGVHAGTGFTATRNAAGDFTVTVGFELPPVVLVSAGETAAYYVAKLYGGSAPSVTSFRVLCFNPSTLASVDGIFYWWAVG